MRWTLKRLVTESFGTQWRAAEAAGLHETTLSRIITGRRNPTPQERRALSRVLELPQERIFNQDESTQARSAGKERDAA